MKSDPFLSTAAVLQPENQGGARLSVDRLVLRVLMMFALLLLARSCRWACNELLSLNLRM